MEMQQVRYFLAVARTLNFTRAAEECNVTQPALTRAIKQLEDELGGELIRREGRNSHLTDLGNRMRPLLQQCYDSALSAKSLANKLKKGEIASLAIAVSWTLDIDLLVAPLRELVRSFPGIQLRLRRGDASDIAAMLKNGEVELAVGGPLEEWDRLDSWPMFTESFGVMIGEAHKLAESDMPELDVALIREERLLRFSLFGADDVDSATLSEWGLSDDKVLEVHCSRDLERLVAEGFGVAILPASAIRSRQVRHFTCAAIATERTVAVYSVAGRQRSKESGTLLNLLRAIDWESRLSADALDAA
jgi:DNA-binding transcriptional LysR family regulator